MTIKNYGEIMYQLGVIQGAASVAEESSVTEAVLTAQEVITNIIEHETITAEVEDG